MHKVTVSTVVAIGEKTRAIGNGNELLWHLPKDMKRFRKITWGNPIIMGRKTYESIPDKFRPLPGRFNIVMTRDVHYSAPGAVLAYSLKEAFRKAYEIAKEKRCKEIFVGGGQQIYERSLSKIDRLYITVIDSDAKGDAFFPKYKHLFTKIIHQEKGKEKGLSYTFQILEKKKK